LTVEIIEILVRCVRNPSAVPSVTVIHSAPSGTGPGCVADQNRYVRESSDFDDSERQQQQKR